MGVSPKFSHIASFIHFQNPLPSFDDARSILQGQNQHIQINEQRNNQSNLSDSSSSQTDLTTDNISGGHGPNGSGGDCDLGRGGRSGRRGGRNRGRSCGRGSNFSGGGGDTYRGRQQQLLPSWGFS